MRVVDLFLSAPLLSAQIRTVPDEPAAVLTDPLPA